MRRLSGERGASAVLIALCAVILFTIAAWVIDGSALFQERRELQNGADAAALAIAMDCVLGDCGDYNTTAEDYVDPNATSDGDSTVGDVSFPGTDTVRVEVLTADAGDDVDGDSTTVDYTFATVIGKTGYTVEAAAEASWGNVGGGNTLPITISLCEWDRGTNGGIDFAEEPFDPADHVTLYFHTGAGGNGNGNGNGNGGGGGNGPDDCNAGPGHDTDGDGRLPGGFGWLEEEDCVAHVDEDLWVGSGPGASPPNSCDPDDLINSYVLIPVFNDVTEPGGGGWAGQCQLGPGGKCYRIEGFAAFYITGFRFPGGPSWRQNPPCNPPDTCLGGYFTEWVFPGGDGGGNNNFGAKTVWLSS